MKYALLDTDFISKTHTVRIDDDNHLIDRILEMPGYSFICHEQTIVELSRHNSHAPAWLEQQINTGTIGKYTDKRIINEMSGLYGQLAPYRFTNMVKVACDSFDADYFAEHYSDLGNLDYRLITTDAPGCLQKIHKKSLLYRAASAKIRLHRILDGGLLWLISKEHLKRRFWKSAKITAVCFL